jgi:hypothetical protein
MTLFSVSAMGLARRRGEIVAITGGALKRPFGAVEGREP